MEDENSEAAGSRKGGCKALGPYVLPIVRFLIETSEQAVVVKIKHGRGTLPGS